MKRSKRLVGNLARAIALCAACITGGAHMNRAEARPGSLELRLTPVTTGSNLGALSSDGLRIISPERGGSLTVFGLGLGLGFLMSRYVEPGFAFNLSILSGGGNTSTFFGLVPFLKINTWLHPRFNPFIEPFAGFAVASGNGSSGAFDGGLYLGGEILFGNWGIRLHTGFEVLRGSATAFIFPFGWSLIGYI